MMGRREACALVPLLVAAIQCAVADEPLVRGGKPLPTCRQRVVRVP
jgi:hypothetical protein